MTPAPAVLIRPAADILKSFTPSPAGKALLGVGASAAQYLAALQQNHQSADAVQLLAHGLPERDATGWAVQSAQQVRSKLTPADAKALDAADLWVKQPTAANQKAAAQAAATAGLHGPGAWAAQAAAWAAPVRPQPAAALPPAPLAVTPPLLVPKAVAGAVQLSAALAAGHTLPPVPDMQKLSLPVPAKPTLPPPVTAPAVNPAQQAQAAKALQPFVVLGQQISAGQKSWS